MNKKYDIFTLSMYGLFIALVCVMTMMVQIPVPVTNGYIHLGDSCILLVAIFFGKRAGFLAGGIGSMLADILSGYAHWAIPTLIIKSLMGLAAGYISQYYSSKSKFISLNTVGACLVSIAIMISGYFIASTIMKGTMASAIQSAFPNMIQGFMGILVFFVIGKAFDKIKLSQYIKKFQH